MAYSHVSLFKQLVTLHSKACSDYRHQDDENVASRGSIAMKSAVLRHSAGDKLRFEIHSTPSRGHSSSSQQKWYIKGNHAVEVNRWAQAIVRNIEHYKRDGNINSGSDTDIRSLKSLGTSLRTARDSLSTIPGKRQSGMQAMAKSSSSSVNEAGEDSQNIRQPQNDFIVGQAAVEESESEDSDERIEDESSDSNSIRSPPHETTFALHGNTTAAQVDLTVQLLNSFKLPPNSSPELQDIYAALEESAITTQRMIGEYVNIVQEREEWWKERLDRERERGALWEESLQVVVKEGEVLENELKNRIRRRNKDTNEGSLRTRSDLQPGLRLSPRAQDVEQHSQYITKPEFPSTSVSNVAHLSPKAPTPTCEPSYIPQIPVSPPPITGDSESMVDTDEEDEFFDAIESNLLPNVVIPDALVNVPTPKSLAEVEIDQYEGYKNLRQKLPMDRDTRPPTSLWSVLKHSIGKDLTKISFPVFFNEPTSMLQRMVSTILLCT